MASGLAHTSSCALPRLTCLPLRVCVNQWQRLGGVTTAEAGLPIVHPGDADVAFLPVSSPPPSDSCPLITLADFVVEKVHAFRYCFIAFIKQPLTLFPLSPFFLLISSADNYHGSGGH